MRPVHIKKIAAFILVFAGMCFGLFAQEKNEAIKVFNEGVELMKANDPRAIGSFENCIRICEQIGDSANDIKEKAIKVLPDLYYQKAFDLLTIDKNIDGALQASKITLTVAEKYSDAQTKDNTQKLMIQAYSAKASSFVTAKEGEKAIMTFDSILAINPEHVLSIYNKSLIYRGMNNNAKFAENIDLYIQKMQAAGDKEKTEQAMKIARDYFRIAGGKANQANKLADAISMLTTASKYGTDENIYYQFASVYNKQKKFDLAIDNAKKGLELEDGTSEDKAKFHFELAQAQFGKGLTADACESYKNAMYGPFLQASKAQRTNLKCQ